MYLTLWDEDTSSYAAHKMILDYTVGTNDFFILLIYQDQDSVHFF